MKDKTELLHQARTLLDAGRPGLALVPCQRFLTDHPDDPEAVLLSGEIHVSMGRLDAAEELLNRAAELHANGEAAPGLESARRALQAARWGVQAERLTREGHVTAAADALARAAERVPERPWPMNNLGTVMMSMGRVDEAMALFRQAAYHSTHPMRAAHSNLLFAMLHSDRVTPQETLAEHRAWAGRYPRDRSRMSSFPPPTFDPPDPDRPIRVGYVSPDFRDHPVAMFLLPVLQHHDRQGFEVTCYSDVVHPDATTARIRAAAGRWVDSSTMTLETLFARVRSDRIDILIDLAVHSGQNRQPLFAFRPAPIQMTWLGYAGTTGSDAIDYRITDAVVDPPGLTESHFTERLLRLPESLWCFGPPDNAPVPMPATTERHLRIGTATRLAKVTPTCLDLWCNLMCALPEATLALASDPFIDPEARAEWMGHFKRRGIVPQRLELRPAMGYQEYLRFLGELDLGLDTFPFNGGTTVCQTLWMGTPVVALAGKSSVSRVSASILTAMGQADWVVESPGDWIARNVELARDATARVEARGDLRRVMAQSLLCDAPRFVRGLEAAFRQVFRDRCAAPDVARSV